MDPCLFWKLSEDSPQDFQGVLVDDTIYTGTDSFMNIREDASKVSEIKARTSDFTLTFNGITIERDSKSSEAMLRCEVPPHIYVRRRLKTPPHINTLLM